MVNIIIPHHEEECDFYIKNIVTFNFYFYLSNKANKHMNKEYTILFQD